MVSRGTHTRTLGDAERETEKLRNGHRPENERASERERGVKKQNSEADRKKLTEAQGIFQLKTAGKVAEISNSLF